MYLCSNYIQGSGFQKYFKSVVRGYHVYKTVWPNPEEDKELTTKHEPDNEYDMYAVAVEKKSGEIVGHIPREFSKIASQFIEENGTIECRVSGPPQEQKVTMHKRKGNLEVPCTYRFRSQDESVLETATNALKALHIPQADRRDQW